MKNKNLFWVLLGAAVAAGVLSRGGVWDYFSQRTEYERMSQKLQEARRRFSGKQVLVARAEKEDEFIEAEARRHLGLLKPDEIEFRFLPASGEPAGEMRRVDPPLKNDR